MFSELMVLKQAWQCLLYCIQLRFNDVIFGFDSAEFVHWFNQVSSPLWKFLEIWDDIITFGQSLSFSLQQIYREGNSVADQLAKASAKGLFETFFLSYFLPSLAWDKLKLDLIDLTKFRHRL